VSEAAGALEAVRSEAETVQGSVRDAFALLRQSKAGLLGLTVTILFAIVGIVGAVVLLVPGFHHLWEGQSLLRTLSHPSASHPLGTDELGRDVMWRTIAGTGIALLMGLEVAVLVLGIGLFFGSIAGFFGGWLDTIIIGLIDLVWGFPLLLIAVLVAGMVGAGLKAIVIAVGVVLWAGFARVVRAEVRSLRERDFAQAARALGVRSSRIITRHMIPNIVGTLVTMASYYVATTVIVEASFSFIGLGAQPPTPSLGSMIADGRGYWYQSAWPTVAPGVVICAIVLGLNLLGDSLRDIFDPRMRHF
jgi:peptide/nickel transport system permease protein